MIANLRRPGTASRNTSSRLPGVSVCWFDSPVTFPPGRARLAIRPMRTGSTASTKTIGITEVVCLTATGRISTGNNHVDFEADELSRDLCKPLAVCLCPAILGRNGAPLDPPKFAQPLHESCRPWFPGRGCSRSQVPDSPTGLLRARYQRPRGRRAAECSQQFPPSDDDCHTPLPREVRRGKDTTLRARGLHGSRRAGCSP